jgi:hypothetical protein
MGKRGFVGEKRVILDEFYWPFNVIISGEFLFFSKFLFPPPFIFVGCSGECRGDPNACCSVHAWLLLRIEGSMWL